MLTSVIFLNNIVFSYLCICFCICTLLDLPRNLTEIFLWNINTVQTNPSIYTYWFIHFVACLFRYVLQHTGSRSELPGFCAIYPGCLWFLYNIKLAKTTNQNSFIYDWVLTVIRLFDLSLEFNGSNPNFCS